MKEKPWEPSPPDAAKLDRDLPSVEQSPDAFQPFENTIRTPLHMRRHTSKNSADEHFWAAMFGSSFDPPVETVCTASSADLPIGAPPRKPDLLDELITGMWAGPDSEFERYFKTSGSPTGPSLGEHIQLGDLKEAGHQESVMTEKHPCCPTFARESTLPVPALLDDAVEVPPDPLVHVLAAPTPCSVEEGVFEATHPRPVRTPPLLWVISLLLGLLGFGLGVIVTSNQLRQPVLVSMPGAKSIMPAALVPEKLPHPLSSEMPLPAATLDPPTDLAPPEVPRRRRTHKKIRRRVRTSDAVVIPLSPFVSSTEPPKAPSLSGGLPPLDVSADPLRLRPLIPPLPPPPVGAAPAKPGWFGRLLGKHSGDSHYVAAPAKDRRSQDNNSSGH